MLPMPLAPRAMASPSALPAPLLLDVAMESGAEETRTLNFHLAKVALYQLSYRPKERTALRRRPRLDGASIGSTLRDSATGPTCRF